MVDSNELSRRSAREVFDDHLQLAESNNVDVDLERNVAPDIVVLTGRGIFHGYDGVQELARQLMDEVPGGGWRYGVRLVEGRMAYLEWTVESGPFRVPDGADSFLIEGGKIVAQTIHYTVLDEHGNVVVRADGTRP